MGKYFRWFIIHVPRIFQTGYICNFQLDVLSWIFPEIRLTLKVSDLTTVIIT